MIANVEDNNDYFKRAELFETVSKGKDYYENNKV